MHDRASWKFSCLKIIGPEAPMDLLARCVPVQVDKEYSFLLNGVL